MYTPLTIEIGPGTRAHLRRLEREEGIDTKTVVEEAVMAWSHLRGADERRQAIGAVLDIVVDRVRPKRGAAA